MATGSKVNVEINVTAPGLNEANKGATQLHNTLKGAATAAQQVRVPGAVAAARQGVAASSAPRMMAAAQGNTATATNLSRGVAGATGAEGRDFAKQARGLGGLVHVYATFAANLFAVSAAFGALKAAMDTSNMVKGLDQLGAASGMALGSLSKRLVKATDDAISLREAMEATAKASSSGMSSTQILRMGEAAKKASQALGVDMSDAVSRISRGITKLEPELLDELGIFIRIDDVVKNYANSVGKAASSLTDFERRQAFANAVLDQAEKKFSAIEIDSNPYAKLLASMKDVAQTGLELINKVFAPILSLLSSSPTALATAMAGIGALLLKQAIPALGMFKENLQQSADQAKKLALIKSVEAQKGYKAIAAAETTALVSRAKQEYEIAKRTAEDISEQKVEAVVQAENKIKALSRKALGGKETKGILSKETFTQDDVAKLDNVVKTSEQSLAKAISEGNTQRATMLQNRIAAHKLYSSSISSLLKEDEEYEKKIIVAKENSLVLQKKYQDSEDSRVKSLIRNRSILNTDRQTQIIADRALIDSASRTIIAQSAQTASVKGFSAAWKEARTSIKEAQSGPLTSMMDLGNKQLDEQGNLVPKLEAITTPAMGKIRGAWVLTRVAITSATSAISTFMNVLAPWVALIGLVLSVGGALISWLSDTKEESAATSAALNGVTESGKALYNTLDQISTKPLLEQLSISSISAKATAISEMGEQMRKSFSTSTAEIKKMGITDVFTNWVSKAWDGDVESKLTDTISRGLFRTFQAIDQSSGPGKEAAEAIKRILNVKDLSSSLKIEAALEGMSSGERRIAIDLITSKMQMFGKEMLVTSAKGTELQSSFAKVAEAKQKLANEFSPNDSLSNYGNSLIDTYFKLNIALSDPEQKLNSINELAKGIAETDAPTSLVLGVQALANTGNSLQLVTSEIVSITKGIEDIESRLAAIPKIVNNKASFDTSIKGETNRGALDTNIKEVERLSKALETLKARKLDKLDIQVNLKATLDSGADTIRTATLGVFKAGADIVSSKLSAEWAKGALAISGAVANILGGTEAGIRLSAQNEKAALVIQANQIKAQRDLILATQNQTIAVEENTLSNDRKIFNDTVGMENRTVRDEGLAKLKAREDAIAYRKNLILTAQSGKGVFKGVSADVAKGLPAATEAATTLAKQLDASAAALNAISGQLTAVDITANDRVLQLMFETQSKLIDNEQRALALKKENANINKVSNADINIAAIAQQRLLDIEEVRLAEKKNILTIDKEIARLDLLKASKGVTSKQIADADISIKEWEKRKAPIREDTEGKIRNINSATELKLISAKNAELAKQNEYAKEADASKLAKSQEINASQLKLLEIAKNQGIYSEKAYLDAKLTLDRAKEQVELDIKINSAKYAQSEALAKIRAEEEQIAESAVSNEGLLTEAQKVRAAELNVSRIRIAETYTDTVNRAEALKTVDDKVLAATKEIADQQLKWNDILKETEGIAQSLSTVFGEVGDAIGSTLKVLLDMAKADEDYLKNKLILQKAIDSGSPTDKKAAEEQMIKLNKDRAKSEVTNIGVVAGASKKMFKEKTGAYKILSAVEKAAHIAKIAMTIKEMFFDAASTTSSVVNSSTRTAASVVEAGVDGVKAVVKAISTLPVPFNFIAGAATAAVVGSLLSSIGGSSPSVSGSTTGLTAADRQEVQGTGQTWQNGKKVDTGGGVFGDSSAKSTAIVDSLEVMKANSIVGLDYDKSMLKALQKLADSIVGAAKSLYSVPGLRAGTGFGTSEGATAGGRGGLLGSIFGGKTTSTTSIESAGLQFRGTFDTLMNSITSSVVQYKDVLTQYTKSGGLFSKDRAWATLSRETKALEKEVAESIGDIFRDANSLFLELGQKTKVTASVIEDTLKTFNTSFDIDLKGLTGDALIAELNGVIGGILSEAAEALFKGFEMFRKFGEDYLQTVLRVVDGNNKVSQALISMGNAFNILSNFNVSEILIENAGGLEAFMDQTSFFNEKFLTAAEQLAPVQRGVSQQLVNLGLSATTTADQFKGLVLAQDLSTKTGQDMFQSLMELAPGFVAVKEATEGTKSSLSKLIIELLQLQGKTAEALALTRKEELDALSDSEKVIKLQIYALQDEKSLREKILSLRDKEKSALESTLSTLNKYIDSLKDQKIALLGGTTSTLTPKQKYDEAQRRQQELAQRAQGPATTAEELAARNKALDELPAANTAFLESSRMLFASSETYARDFASVINTIDSTSLLLESQKTDTEKQLEQLQANTAFLDAISQSTETMSSLLAEYLLNQDRFIAAQNYVPNLAESLAMALTVTAPTIAHANAVALTGTTAADSAIATDTSTAATNTASSFLGVTTPTGTISDTAGAGDPTTSDAGFSTSAERASYYADNTTMAAVTATLMDVLGKTTVGMAINALMPDAVAAARNETRGINADSNITAPDFDFMADSGVSITAVADTNITAADLAVMADSGVSITAVADTNITATDLAVMADSISVYGGDYGGGAGAPGANSDGYGGGDAGFGGNSQAFAKGGLASGFSLVGEEGPEFVDFQSPGRVYTAQQTQGMFANNTQIQKQLIQEVQNLRKELTRLREQQSKETGHLITATYDANMKAADKVAAATEDAANQSDWATRSAVKIA